MIDVILSTMAHMLATAAADKNRERDADYLPNAGPFSKEEYDDNAIASANYETMLAVRKAHTRLRQGHPDMALSLLIDCRKRLPATAETKALDHLILQLSEVQGE